MKYSNASLTIAKAKLISRLSYIVNSKLQVTSGRAIADSIGVSANIISKLKRDISTGISFDAALEVAERLNVNYEISIIFTHRGRSVDIKLEDLYPINTATKVSRAGISASIRNSRTQH